jgi:hypothetical protein
MNSVGKNSFKKSGIILGGIFLMFAMFLSVSKTIEAKTGIADEKTIEGKCSKCHDTRRVFFLKRSPKQWKTTVLRMQGKDPQWLSDADIETSINFLNRYSSKTGKDLFQQSCVNCHRRLGKKQLLFQRKTIPAWRRAIARMQRKHIFFIGVEDAEQISEYWTDPNNNKNLKLDLEETDLIEGVFENKCGRCHTYNFMYGAKAKKEDWLEILTRMQEKSPSWMDEQAMAQIKEYIFSNKKLLLDKD